MIDSIDSYAYIIVALLPLTSLMLVTQTNPYHALVIRAILGAVAALVYAILGAADVALTEALVGTMLAVTLYIIAVRSSLVMRLGIVEENIDSQDLQELIKGIRKTINNYHLRLELIEYSTLDEQKKALENKDIHCYYTRSRSVSQGARSQNLSQLTTRIQRLFEILETELDSSEIKVNYVANTPMDKNLVNGNTQINV